MRPGCSSFVRSILDSGLAAGSLGLSIGLLWRVNSPWSVSLPVTALVRSVGVVASLAASSLLLRENVMALVVAQLHALLEQICLTMDFAQVPELSWVYSFAGVLILVNSLCYTVLLHLLYSIFAVAAGPGLTGGGSAFGAPPSFLRRALSVQSVS